MNVMNDRTLLEGGSSYPVYFSGWNFTVTLKLANILAEVLDYY